MQSVKVLHSRNGIGFKGDVIRVTEERKKTLLEAGLVEEIKTASKSEESKKGKKGQTLEQEKKDDAK